MRRRYRWSDEHKALVEIPWDSRQESLAPAVFDDFPAYASPIDGRLIDGRRARREDLKRSGCRPYEGREAEMKEAAKVKAEESRQMDQLAERMAHKAWDLAPESVRKQFRYK